MERKLVTLEAIKSKQRADCRRLPLPILVCIYIFTHLIYLDPPGVPNGWERVPLSNPVGFQHHPWEGAGRGEEGVTYFRWNGNLSILMDPYGS